MPKIVGLIRFSVLSEPQDPANARKTNPFGQAYGRSFQEYSALILDERRLKDRFELFESICLPSLDAQTNMDVRVIVIAPRLLPPRWKERLGKIVANRKMMRVVYAHEHNYSNNALRRWTRQELSPSDDAVITFRLDDDDAVSRTFVERLSRYARPEFIGHAISLSSGYFLHIDREAGKFSLQPADKRNISVGMAYVADPKRLRTILDLGNHTKVHRRCPTITDSTVPAFVLTTHGDNDSGRRRGQILELTRAEVARELEPHFNLDLAGLSPVAAAAQTAPNSKLSALLRFMGSPF